MLNSIVRGLVIKEVLVGESDKIITILAKDIGKISVSAKGSRKSSSKILAGTQMFSYADFELSNKFKYPKIVSVDIIKSYYTVTNDYDALCIASYMCELYNKTIEEYAENNDLLKLILHSLQALQNNVMNKKLIMSIFDMKFMDLYGYTPIVNECVVCGSVDDNIYFGSEGVVCKNCNTGIRINQTIVYTLNYIIDTDIEKLFNFELSNENIQLLNKVSRSYVKGHMDIKIKSLEFLE